MVQKYIIDKTDIHDLIMGKELALQPRRKARAFCVEISGELTNGDLIMALFPKAKWWVNEDNEVFTDMPWKPRKVISFDLDWWKARYKGEREET